MKLKRIGGICVVVLTFYITEQLIMTRSGKGNETDDRVLWKILFRQSTKRLSDDVLSMKLNKISVLRGKNNLPSKSNVSKTFTLSKERKSKIRIGILIPACTRKLKNPVLQNLSLTKVCLPSVYKTLEDDYAYSIYIGIDKGDYLESVQHNLTTMFANVTTVVAPTKSLAKSVNVISRVAYEDDMDYLVRINDDTSLETQNWTSYALDILMKYKPPNIGVVGPTFNEGNTRILTHDMVHRTHIKIFGFYYPIYFDNWWADDWITNVYQPERSTKLVSWRVIHHIHAHGTRYDVDMKKVYRLNKIVSYDKRRLLDYLTKVTKSTSK